MSTIEKDPEHAVKNSAHSSAPTEQGNILRKRTGTRAGSAFVGRLGGNQEFIDVTLTLSDAPESQTEPDAAPGMTLRQQLALRSFLHVPLWKAAVIEGMGQSS